MTLDDQLAARRADLAQERRVEPVTPDCLTFAALSADRLSAAQESHCSSCDRCQTLRMRLLDAVKDASRGELEWTEPAHPQPRRARQVLVGLATAACVLFAAWIGFEQGTAVSLAESQALYDRAMHSRAVVDGALRVLGDHPRGTEDPVLLLAENDALRTELQRIIRHLDHMVVLAERSPGDGQ